MGAGVCRQCDTCHPHQQERPHEQSQGPPLAHAQGQRATPRPTDAPLPASRLGRSQDDARQAMTQSHVVTPCSYALRYALSYALVTRVGYALVTRVGYALVTRVGYALVTHVITHWLRVEVTRWLRLKVSPCRLPCQPALPILPPLPWRQLTPPLRHPLGGGSQEWGVPRVGGGPRGRGGGHRARFARIARDRFGFLDPGGAEDPASFHFSPRFFPRVTQSHRKD